MRKLLATNALSNAGLLWALCSADLKQRFRRILLPDGLIFDGESYQTATTCLSFQLLAGDFERKFKFGVAKHSELEPNHCLAERNGSSPTNCALVPKTRTIL